MRVTNYFHQLEQIIADCPAITSQEIFYDQRTKDIGFIKGILIFNDSSQLHFKEFIEIQNGITKYKYGYHYQKSDKLIFRYDNYIHSSKSPVHHKHHPLNSKLIPVSNVPTLKAILQEIISLLP